MSQIDAFKAMLERGQDSEMLRFTLGNAYFADKAYSEAAWKMLGRSLAANEELSEALNAFDRGLEAGEANGDKQTVKEITVFRRRVVKALEATKDDKES